MKLRKKWKHSAFTSAVLGILTFCLLAGFSPSGSSVFLNENSGEETGDSLEEFRGALVGVLTGTNIPSIVEEYVPDAEVLLYNTTADQVMALKTGKVDAIAMDEPVARNIQAQDSSLEVFPSLLGSMDYAYILGKGETSEALCGELSAYIRLRKEDGTLDTLQRKWFDTADLTELECLDYRDLPAEKGTLTMAVFQYPPFILKTDDVYVGYELELMTMFCRSAGYALNIDEYTADAIMSAVQSHKADIGGCSISITEERKEKMLFTEPDYSGGTALLVRKEEKDSQMYTAIEQLRGKKIGSCTGTTYDAIVKKWLPDAEFSYFNTYSDMVTSLAAGKIAAFACDEPVYTSIKAQNDNVERLPEYLDTFSFAYAFSKNEKGEALCEQMSAFIEKMKTSGQLDELNEKWLSGNMEQAVMPDVQKLNGENGTLVMASESLNPPFEYIQNNVFSGYEAELAVLFCEEYGYGLTIQDMSFDAILPAVQTGKADFGAASISVTPERSESVLFSEPHYEGGTVLAIWKGKKDSTGGSDGEGLSFLDGKNIGIQTGTIFQPYIEERLPNATMTYYDTAGELIQALKDRKIDAFPVDEILLKNIMRKEPDIWYPDEYLDEIEGGLAFPKTKEGEVLCEEANRWLNAMRQSGELDHLIEVWFSDENEGKQIPEYDSLPDINGTLILATDSELAPLSYMEDGKQTGFEIALATRFCKDRGYALEIRTMQFNSILQVVEEGEVDFAAAAIAITEDRSERMLFSAPYYLNGTVMAVLKETPPSGWTVFWNSVKESFEKTFVREGRWLLFLQGIGTTLLITILSILFGTLLGFLVFLICRRGNPVANTLTSFFVWLLQGMPVVVLLMILYYIVFGKVGISGTAVSIIGFSLLFGTEVYSMVKAGVATVEQGQMEAACSLGFTDTRAFFKIILPQALPHIVPVYKAGITSLIKATVIVGYVAVQDLTKMGDIVRSRTYDAFFPLIAVAIIYFILAAVLIFVVGRIELHIDPKLRKKEDILKGVMTHD